MVQFEYKVIPAPAKSQKAKGAGAAEDRFAATLADALNGPGRAGWEFLRSETLPVEERQGLTGTRTVFRSVLVFRRAVEIAEDDATRAALRFLEDRGT
ncbi:MAG: hypothetical protein KDA50_04900 [Rhodobacteraceae bacterium]|nr:hypothetical protein [Paracoccaceae bacterium]